MYCTMRQERKVGFRLVIGIMEEIPPRQNLKKNLENFPNLLRKLDILKNWYRQY